MKTPTKGVPELEHRKKAKIVPPGAPTEQWEVYSVLLQEVVPPPVMKVRLKLQVGRVGFPRPDVPLPEVGAGHDPELDVKSPSFYPFSLSELLRPPLVYEDELFFGGVWCGELGLDVEDVGRDGVSGFYVSVNLLQ